MYINISIYLVTIWVGTRKYGVSAGIINWRRTSIAGDKVLGNPLRLVASVIHLGPRNAKRIANGCRKCIHYSVRVIRPWEAMFPQLS